MDLPIKDFFHSYVSLPEGTGDMMGIVIILLVLNVGNGWEWGLLG